LRLRLLGRPDKLTLDSDKLLAKEATFVVTSGDRARGALEQFLAIGPSRALVPTASEVDMSDSTADVARRGPDGWKFIVDNPFGTG
jgi:hypothetical protein